MCVIRRTRKSGRETQSFNSLFCGRCVNICSSFLAQGSNFFLLTRKESITCAIFVAVFCVPRKPNGDGSQGMDGVGCSFGVDPGAPRTEATLSAVAIDEVAVHNVSCGVSGTNSVSSRTPPPIPQNRQPARAPEVRVHRSPDEVAAAAQQRVQRLEAALQTLGDEDTPEVKSLQDALKKAKVAAQGIPVEGAVGRVPEVCCKMREAHRCIGCGTVQGIGTFGGRKIKSGASPTDCGQPASRTPSRFFIRGGAIAKASGRFAAAIGARYGCTTMREASGRGSQGTGSSIAGGFRAHVRFRDRPMDARPSSRSPRRQPHGECERSHEVVPRDSRDSIRHGPIFRVAFHGDEFHPDGAVRIVTHQCGMRGIRVGEARNPGPSRRPVRPIHGRDVAPRTASEHGTMLDSDSDAPLARVGPRLGTRHDDCPQSRVLPRATLLDSDSDAPVMSTAVCGQLLDALEEDLTRPVIPQKKRVRRVSDSPSPTRGSGGFKR